jgi:polyvinyl alcohol dehydrogenase (cytochrome)
MCASGAGDRSAKEAGRCVWTRSTPRADKFAVDAFSSATKIGITSLREWSIQYGYCRAVTTTKKIRIGTRLALCLALSFFFPSASFADTDDASKVAGPKSGGQLFEQHCAACHTGFLGSRAPSKQVLAKFPPRSIVHALAVGVMRLQGGPLSGDDRRAVAEYLTGKKFDNDIRAESRGKCEAHPEMADPGQSPQWNGWGNSAGNASFQSAQAAGLTAESVKELKLKWTFGFPDSFSAWAQPVVASNRLFVGSQAGIFYSISAATGCTYWQFTAEAGVRGAASVIAFDKQAQDKVGAKFGVLFGDMSGNAYALDADTGRLLWKTKVDAHPKARVTGSPTLFEGRYFVPMSSWSTVGEAGEECCTFRGSLSALDAVTGKLLWKTYTIPAEAKPLTTTTQSGKRIWGPSGSGLVYAGTGNSYTSPAVNSDSVVAFDLRNGAIRWVRQLTPDDVWVPNCKPKDIAHCRAQTGPDFDIGSPPMIVQDRSRGAARDLIVVGQKSGLAYALDPEQKGAVVWKYRAGEGSSTGGIVWGSAAMDATVYFPLSDITTEHPGGIHAVTIASGKRRWVKLPGEPICGSPRYGCNGAQPVGISVAPGILFAGSVDGGFRAYSSEDGSILWQYDTNRKYETVNGVAANGGSLIGAGSTIAGGMVFVNSGYGTNGGRSGNVLLAFSIH